MMGGILVKVLQFHVKIRVEPLYPGDAGGPLVCQGDNNRPTLCGLVSWGLGCGRSGYYGVYTEISFFKQWIDEMSIKLS